MTYPSASKSKVIETATTRDSNILPNVYMGSLENAINALQNTVDDLEKRLNELKNRLVSVTVPDPGPKDSFIDHNVPRPPNCPAVDKLEGITQNLRHLIDETERAINTLAT